MGSNKYERESFDSYKNYINQLKNEFRTSFDKIEVYINGSSKLNYNEKNNCLLEILDSFLSAQAGDNPVKNVTGADLKKYCDSMIYGEAIHIYKASRICSIILGSLFYISFIHLFTCVFHAIGSKDSNLIFQPMYFGMGEIVLILGYMCIPKLIALITRNYFENPVRCKRVKRITYNVVWIFTILIYSFSKEYVKKYVTIIPFSNIVLILIYLAIITSSVWLLTKSFDEGNSEEKKTEKESKYIKRLNVEYNKHIKKCEEHSKTPLDWNNFVIKKAKNNSLFIKIFFVYSIIFLVFAILIGRGMLVEGNINVIGIAILLGISFLDVVIVSAVRDFIQINKKLIEM